MRWSVFCIFNFWFLIHLYISMGEIQVFLSNCFTLQTSEGASQLPLIGVHVLLVESYSFC